MFAIHAFPCVETASGSRQLILCLVRLMRALFAYLALASFLSFSAVVAETVQHGDTRVYFDPEPIVANSPIPVGGVGAFTRKLWFPRELRTRPYIVSGKSIVSITVEADGRATNVSFSPRMDPKLEHIVIEAARSCRWKPARNAGVPVRAKCVVPITFRTSYLNR